MRLGLGPEWMCSKPALHKGQTRARPTGPALLQPDEPHTQSNHRDNYIKTGIMFVKDVGPANERIQ